MEQKLNKEKEPIELKTENIELIKQNLISLLELDGQEKAAISNIKDLTELSIFLERPEQYMTELHVTELKEVIELLNLMGGMYFA